jgi:hypothetical protein
MCEEGGVAVPFWSEELASRYKVFRDYVQHEDDLINHRSTWHHTIQGLLFASLGFTLQGKSDAPGTVHGAPVQWALLFVLPLLGIALAIAAWTSIRAATKALDELTVHWKKILGQYPEAAKVCLPELTGAGDAWAIRWGKTPAYAIPVCIGVAWFVMLLAAIYTSLMPATVVVTNLNGLPCS